MRLFYENKFFNFISEADYREVSALSEGETTGPILQIRGENVLTPEELLTAIGEEHSLTIVAHNGEETLKAFCQQMPIIRAAGGVVENDLGEVLMMTRKGWRDLPKGHIDEGESDEEAAVREVMEECGLQAVEIVAPLCTTRHFHNAYGRWEVKQTEWFVMLAPGEAPEITPQQDENITAVEWLRGRRLWKAVDSSYSTIKTLFEHYLDWKIR